MNTVISCPHYFCLGGMIGCTAEGIEEFDCKNCNHPDKRVDVLIESSASTIKTEEANSTWSGRDFANHYSKRLKR